MRFLKVTLILFALGAIAGAIAGTVTIIGAAIIAGPRNPTAEVFGWAAMVGALVGGVTGPPIAWIFLRRVPLWRATAETAAAAAVGNAVGATLNNLSLWLVLLVGFALLAALRLRYVYRKTPDRVPAETEV